MLLSFLYYVASVPAGTPCSAEGERSRQGPGDPGRPPPGGRAALPGQAPDKRFPVVSDDVGRGKLQRIQDPDDVSDCIRKCVGRDVLRPVSPPEPAQVGGDRAKAVRCEKRDLVPPQVGRVRPPVEQHNGRPGAVILDVKRKPVDFRRSLLGRVLAVTLATTANTGTGKQSPPLGPHDPSKDSLTLPTGLLH